MCTLHKAGQCVIIRLSLVQVGLSNIAVRRVAHIQTGVVLVDHALAANRGYPGATTTSTYLESGDLKHLLGITGGLGKTSSHCT